MQLEALQLPVRADDHLHPVADSLAAKGRHLPEQLQHLLSGERHEAYLVFKRRHLKHVAISHFALRQRGPDTSHVVDGEVGSLMKGASGPHQDVRQQVRQVAFGLPHGHVRRGIAHHRAHQRVDLGLILRNELHGITVGMRIITAVHEQSGALDGRQPVMRFTRTE